ncbi:Werner syndrome ATP-dependent helicase-like protein, partial [Bienertia sinuspersici]
MSMNAQSKERTVLEVVAFFLHTLAQDLKNRTISVVLTRSGETVSRQFHSVLKVVMKIGSVDTVEDKEEDFISMAQASPQWISNEQTNTRNLRLLCKLLKEVMSLGINKWMTFSPGFFLEENNNKEKGDEDFKPQAYQAVVDELKKELGIAINVDHVRNRTKSWKKHYDCIMDIRTYS